MPTAPAEPSRIDTEPTQFLGDAAVVVAPAPDESAEGARTESARELIRACEAELGARPEAARAGRLHYEMARAYEVALDDLEQARDHYLKACAALPDLVPAIRGARRALVSLGRHLEALPLFDAEARLGADARHKAMLLYEKGALLEDRLGQRKEARRAYAAALELDDGNPSILKAFERASTLAAEWDDVERAMEREANAVSSDARHRAALTAARARIADARKADPGRAIELYRTALALDPRAPGALAALKTLLYEHERWRDLIVVLEEEALQAGTPETRALARYRIAKLHLDRLGSLDEAITALESAARESPGDPMVQGELARVYELGKRWGKLTEVLEAVAASTGSTGERVALMHRIGQIAEERLDDAERAIGWYRRALDSDPAYVPALQALGKLYAQRGHFTALIAMHLGEAGAARDGARRAAAHARVAEILERKLGNVDQAIEHHARALGLVPGYAPSFKALARLYSQGNRHRELAELYERAVDLARDDETKITYLFKIGRIHEDVLSAPLSALTAYQRILKIDPGHLGALHALQRAAERGEAWEELVRALDDEATRTADKADRAALVHRAAEVAEEHLGDVAGAITRYKSVLSLEPTYAPALSSLGRLQYAAGRFEDLLATYQLELAVTTKGGPTAALLYKMGELAEERLGRSEDAMRHYRAAIEADPHHLTAIRALARLESERGQWKEVVRLLEIELGAHDDKPARARIAFRIGEVYENRIQDRVKALAAYERALEHAPDFRPALDGRSRLLERAKEYDKLVGALEREAELSKDPALAVVATQRAAEIFRDHLGDPQRAVAAFRQALEMEPNHLGALLSLEPLHAELAQKEELSQALEGQARVLENGFARVAVLRELARLEELRIAAAASDVTDKYLAIVRVAPSDSAALAALERVAISHKNWALLSQVDTKLGVLTEDGALAAAHQTRLAESLELAGDPSAFETYRAALARDPENIAAARGCARLARRLSVPAALEDAAGHAVRVLRDPALAASLLVQSARVRHERQRDPQGAAADLVQALEACPDHEESAVRLSELLVSSEVARLTDVLSHAAGRAKDKERRAALWVAVAGLHADRGGDLGAGLSALARALAEQPDHVPALMKEADLYARDGRAAEAVDRLGRVVAAAPEPLLLVTAQVAMAAQLRERGDTARAAQALRAALATDERHRGALASLLEIEMERGELEPAAGTAARLVAVCPEGPERADALVRLARLEKKRGATAAAVEAYRQALSTTGLEGPARGELRELLAEVRRRGERPPWEAYADALKTYLDRTRIDDPRLAAVYLELSRALASELSDVEGAIQTLRAGVSRFGKDGRLRAELAARFRASGRAAEAAEELRRLVETEPLSVEVWQGLSETLSAIGREDLSAIAGSVLVALGGGTDYDRVAAETRSVRPPALEANALDHETRALLDAGLPEDVATSRLLSCAALGLERVFPPDFDAYGVSRGDRLSPRAGHPTRVIVDRVARILGIGELDVYVHRAHAGSVEVEFGDPVAVMIPAHVAALPEGQQTFLLARVLVDIARGLHPVDKLAPSAIAEVLVGAMRIVDPSFGAGQGNAEYLDTVSKNIYKGLPRRGRRPLEEAAAAYGPSPKPRLDDWLLRVRKTATRAALLISGDPAGVVTILRRTEADQAGLEGVALERGMAVLSDALRFAVSDVATTVRRRIGT